MIRLREVSRELGIVEDDDDEYEEICWGGDGEEENYAEWEDHGEWEDLDDEVDSGDEETYEQWIERV